MASLKALKIRISSVKSTQKITKAMKMVAAAKLRRAQAAAEAARPYSERMASVMASLASKVAVGPQSPKLLAGTGKDQTHLLVVCTSDRGLAGAFNTNIVRAARRKAEELTGQGKNVYFYLVGRKGRAVIQRFFPKQIIHQHDTSEIKQVAFTDAQAIANDLVERYQTDGIDVVHLFYAKFQSALVQEPVAQQIIPVQAIEGASADDRQRASAGRGVGVDAHGVNGRFRVLRPEPGDDRTQAVDGHRARQVREMATVGTRARDAQGVSHRAPGLHVRCVEQPKPRIAALLLERGEERRLGTGDDHLPAIPAAHGLLERHLLEPAAIVAAGFESE